MVNGILVTLGNIEHLNPNTVCTTSLMWYTVALWEWFVCVVHSARIVDRPCGTKKVDETKKRFFEFFWENWTKRNGCSAWVHKLHILHENILIGVDDRTFCENVKQINQNKRNFDGFSVSEDELYE